eukprot:299229-Rhodomonas_salina.3
MSSRFAPVLAQEQASSPPPGSSAEQHAPRAASSHQRPKLPSSLFSARSTHGLALGGSGRPAQQPQPQPQHQQSQHQHQQQHQQQRQQQYQQYQHQHQHHQQHQHQQPDGGAQQRQHRAGSGQELPRPSGFCGNRSLDGPSGGGESRPAAPPPRPLQVCSALFRRARFTALRWRVVCVGTEMG